MVPIYLKLMFSRLFIQSLIRYFGCPTNDKSEVPCKAYYETFTSFHCVYLFSVNFDTLNAVLGIYSIAYGDYANI